jgi:putative hydrolase of the HAD superfamily
MHEVVGIPLHQVDELRRSYWQRYGVTMQGLMRHHQVDPEDYLTYVHDIDVPSRLTADLELRQALQSLPQRRVVFTNSSVCHSERVLQALGLRDLFEDIFDIRIANYLPKPYPDPYRAVLEQLGAEAGECIMVEDTPENLLTAKQLGMGTVLVGPRDMTDYVDVQIDHAAQMPEAMTFWSAV